MTENDRWLTDSWQDCDYLHVSCRQRVAGDRPKAGRIATILRRVSAVERHTRHERRHPAWWPSRSR